MPPFAGQGYKHWTNGRFDFVRKLTNGKIWTIQSAIDDYEQRMFVYATEAQADSTKNEIEMRNPSFTFQQLMNV